MPAERPSSARLGSASLSRIKAQALLIAARCAYASFGHSAHGRSRRPRRPPAPRKTPHSRAAASARRSGWKRVVGTAYGKCHRRPRCWLATAAQHCSTFNMISLRSPDMVTIWRGYDTHSTRRLLFHCAWMPRRRDSSLNLPKTPARPTGLKPRAPPGAVLFRKRECPGFAGERAQAARPRSCPGRPAGNALTSAD